MLDAAEHNLDISVRSFECLGACDMAPMASVDGVYIGPLEDDDAERIVEAIGSGQPVLEEKQLRRRPCADPAASYAMPGRLKPLIFDRIDEPG